MLVIGVNGAYAGRQLGGFSVARRLLRGARVGAFMLLLALPVVLGADQGGRSAYAQTTLNPTLTFQSPTPGTGLITVPLGATTTFLISPLLVNPNSEDIAPSSTSFSIDNLSSSGDFTGFFAVDENAFLDGLPLSIAANGGTYQTAPGNEIRVTVSATAPAGSYSLLYTLEGQGLTSGETYTAFADLRILISESTGALPEPGTMPLLASLAVPAALLGSVSQRRQRRNVRKA
jgi:hypothetical protein